MVVLGCLFAFAAAIGIGNVLDWPRIFITDAGYFINLLVGYLAVTIFFNDMPSVRTLIQVLWMAFVIKIGAALYLAAIGFGEPVPGMVRPFFDSSRMLLGALIVCHSAYLLNVQHRGPREILMHGAAIMVVLAVMLLQFTRLHVLLTTVSMLTLILVSGWSTGSRLRSSILGLMRVVRRLTPVVIVLSVAVLGTLTLFVRSDSAVAYLVWRMNTMLQVFREPGSVGRDVGSTDIRWTSLVNIWHSLSRHGAVLWGTGLAGSFTDDYWRFPERLYRERGGPAFSPEEMERGRFVRPHGMPLWVLLKMGVIGLLIYYGTAVLIFLKGARSAVRIADDFARFLTLGIVSSFPILFWEMFSTKLQLLQGVLLGVLAVIIAANSRTSQRSTPRDRACEQELQEGLRP